MFIFEKEYLGFFENKHLVIFMDELSYKKEQNFFEKIIFFFCNQTFTTTIIATTYVSYNFLL